MADWFPPLAAFVTGECSDIAYAERSDGLVAMIRNDRSPILTLVTFLGPYLTTVDDPPRCKAIAFLAKVVDEIPDAVSSSGDLQHLSKFFASRLVDWPAIGAALRGCLALLRRTPPLLTPPEAEVVDMLRVVVENVFVRSLGAKDRMTALCMLRCALERHGDALLAADVDLLEYGIASIDGEKDPRCLLESFAVARAMLTLYQRQPAHSLHSGRLEDSVDELFDVLSCYFPITFTPPPDDPHGITRERLAAELQATMAAAPTFAPHVVPLLMEKLSSTLRQAKLDALAALGACAEGYGHAPLAEHLTTLWAALRTELMAPAAEGLLDVEAPGAEEVAAAAADCLLRCTRAFAADGNFSLCALALEDAAVEDLLRCAAAPGATPPTFKRSVLKARAATVTLCALCRVGGEAASRAASHVLPALLDAVQGARVLGSLCLTWTVILNLVQALAAGTASGEEPRIVGGLLQRAAAAAAAIDTAAVLEEAGRSEADPQPPVEWSTQMNSCTLQAVAWLQLTSLTALLGAQPLAAHVAREHAGAALRVVLTLLTASQAAPSALAQAAIAAVCALAHSQHCAALTEAGLPALLTAATQLTGARTGPLAALCTLAAAVPEFQLPVVVALDEALQINLPLALAAGDSEHAPLLLDLLQAATGIARKAESSTTPEGQQQPVVQLAEHLLDAALLLPPSPHPVPAASPALLHSLALAALLAARQADAGKQTALGCAAAGALGKLQGPGDGAVPALQAAVCSGVLLSLRPAAVEEVLGGVDSAAGAVSGLVMGALQHALVAQHVCLAAAALLNKSHPGIDACVPQLMSQVMLPAVVDGGDSAAVSWVVVAALGRGLAMRSSPAVDGIVQALTTMLTDGAAASQHAAAAHCLAAMLHTDSSPESVALNAHSHAVIRPLWQQRLYTMSMSALQKALYSAASTAGSALELDETGSAETGQTVAAAAWPVLLALAQLLAAAPAAIVRNDLVRALPLAVRCLGTLQQAPSPAVPSTVLQSLLGTVSDALGSEQGKTLVQELMGQLVPAVVGLTGYRPAAAVREAALLGLLQLAALPYPALHPHRKQVTKAAAAATDDNKRSVRSMAARCRQAWAPV